MNNNENKADNLTHKSVLNVFNCTPGTDGILTLGLINQLNLVCNEVEDAAKLSAPALILQLDGSPTFQAAEEQKDVYLVGKWEKVLRRIELLNAVVICATQERIGRLGLALMMVSDYRLAKSNTLIELKDNNNDILPGCVIQRIVHQHGTGLTRKLILLGMQMSTQQALNCGMVDEIVEDINVGVQGFVDQLQVSQIKDIRVRRQLMLEAFHLSHDQTVGAHLAACDRLLRSRSS